MEAEQFPLVMRALVARWPQADRWSDDLWAGYFATVQDCTLPEALAAVRELSTEEFPPGAAVVRSSVGAHRRRVARQAALRAGVGQW